MAAVEGADVATAKCPSVQVSVMAINNEPFALSEGRRPKGWRPYMALFAGFCAMANCWGLIMSFGPYFRYYDEHLLPGTGDCKIGMIGSIQAFLVLFSSLFVGRLLDAQLHRYLAVAGGVLTFLGHIFLGFTSHQGLDSQGNYGLILLTQGFIGGLGEACYFVYSSQLAVQWFPQHRFFAVGVTSAGAAAGGLAYPPIISTLIKYLGFNKGVQVQAGIVGAISIIIIIFGNPPPGAKKIESARLLKMKGWVDWAAFRCGPYTLLTVSTMFVFFGYSPLLYFVTEWAEQGNFKVIWFLSFMNGFSIVGRVGSSRLASLKSRRANPLSIHAGSCFFAAVTVLLAWPLARDRSAAWTFCVIFGVLGGSILGLPASGVAHIIPATSQDSLGTWTGMLWSCCCIPALVGPAIDGNLRDRYSIEAVGYWCGANLMVAGFFSMLAFLASPSKAEGTVDTKQLSSESSQASSIYEVDFIVSREQDTSRTPASVCSDNLGTIVRSSQRWTDLHRSEIRT